MNRIYPFLQLFFAGFAVYGALSFGGGLKLYIPLVCVILRLGVTRLDKKKTEEVAVQQSKVRHRMAKAPEGAFTVESMLAPKNELLLVDAVHSLLKDLGLKISTGINYHSVDRILRFPEAEKTFGLEILMSDGELDRNHPKVRKALEFEKERRDNEKIILVARPHCRLPLDERNKMSDVSKEMADLLVSHNISFVAADQLYELWQRAKGGKNDIPGIFNRLHSHPGGIFSLKSPGSSVPQPSELPLQ